MRTADTLETLRSKVLKTAMKAFLERGINDVTMDDLAHELSMSKRTLYEIFVDKEELLLTGLKAIQAWHRNLLKAFIEKSHDSLEVILYDFELKLGEIDRVNPAFFRQLARYKKVQAYLEQARGENREIAIETLKKGASQGHFRNDINFELIYEVMTSFPELIRNSEIALGLPMSEVLLNTAFVYLRGCTTPQGMAIIDQFLERRKQAKYENPSVYTSLE